MKKQEWVFLVCLYSVPWLSYLLFMPQIVGTDSYFYLNLLNILPSQFWLIKIGLGLLGIIFLLGIMLLAKHFKANAYYVGLAAITLTPLIFVSFAHFENDWLAIAFLPFVTWMALQKPLTWKLASMVSLVGLGLIWQGTIYYLIIFGLLNAYFAIPALIAWFWFGYERIIGNILPLASVNESHILEGIAFIALFVPAFIVLPKQKRELIGLTIFFLIIGAVNARFIIHVLPFMAILFYFFVKEVLVFIPKYQDLIKKLCWMTPIYLVVIWSAVLFTYPPSPEAIKTIQEYIDFKPEIEHKNDWSFGHWIRYYGLEPTAWAGGIWEQDYNHGIIMTQQDLNCPVKIDYNAGFKVFECKN